MEEPGSAAMAEESSSGSSGSPGAGDTLPWNLGKHQRSQRAKAAAGNGTVLDPAERAVIRIAGTARGTGTRAGWDRGAAARLVGSA
ncbi:microtubule-actin cross-linking factor 1-like [Motacilla alba alba]|uniref:microtubule-actin cross-linking factor 1-like n=1 Tax=Motacilla alba alba TaxID=1094192 RepID=UPI0018D53212|nr:microtubule-actin cross-linking factor 1-like [Motacilla alba alba]